MVMVPTRQCLLGILAASFGPCWKWNRNKLLSFCRQQFLKAFFLNENYYILIPNSINFVPKGTLINKSTLDQVMVWHRTGDKPLPDSMLTCLYVIVFMMNMFWTSFDWLHIGSGNGLAPNKWQTITWSNVDLSVSNCFYDEYVLNKFWLTSQRHPCIYCASSGINTVLLNPVCGWHWPLSSDSLDVKNMLRVTLEKLWSC